MSGWGRERDEDDVERYADALWIEHGDEDTLGDARRCMRA